MFNWAVPANALESFDKFNPLLPNISTNLTMHEFFKLKHATVLKPIVKDAW